MALQIPEDVPRTQFNLNGLLGVDGNLFSGTKHVSTDVLLRVFDNIKSHVSEGAVRTRLEWEQVRDACLVWCLSHRTITDNEAFNSFLRHVGLADFAVPKDSPGNFLGAIEAKYRSSPTESASPPSWVSQLPPPQRLPTPSIRQDHQLSNLNAVPVPVPAAATVGTAPNTPRGPDLNTNPRFQGVYNFTEHRQEYEGYQFQCIFRCLKDGKHCRKAPVREMNRHLRDRHKFRAGFKIAGVDWEHKKWRGAGADHEECVGKIVEKESADDSDDDSEEEEYVVQ